MGGKTAAEQAEDRLKKELDTQNKGFGGYSGGGGYQGISIPVTIDNSEKPSSNTGPSSGLNIANSTA